jgi:hypothetical protein
MCLKVRRQLRLSCMNLRAKIVQYSNLMPKLQQEAREMSANESSSASNQNVHKMGIAPGLAGVGPDGGKGLCKRFWLSANVSAQ